MTIEIVLYHSGSPDSADAFNSLDLRLNDLLKYGIEAMVPFAMSFFFVTTGYLLFRDLTIDNYVEKIKRRIRSLLIPYVLWQLIIFCKLFIQKRDWAIESFLTKIFLLKMFPPDGPLWYVYAVFLLALLSLLILLLFKNRKTALLFILFVYLCRYGLNSYTSIISNLTASGFIDVSYYFCSYLVGAFYGHFLNDDSDLEELRYVVYLIIIAVLLNGTFAGILYETTITMLPVLLLFVFPADLIKKDLKVSKLLFLVYAVHEPLAVDFNKFVRPFISEHIPFIFIQNILCRTAILLLSFGLAYCIKKVLDKVSPKLLSLLSGGRS